MNAIVLNTKTLSVTEYDWLFRSITANYAGDTLGLYRLGGDLDGVQPIASEIRTGLCAWGDSHKKRIPSAYLSMSGVGAGVFSVQTRETQFDFPFEMRSVARVLLGKGIISNYLSFGFKNTAGADFSLDKIEPQFIAATRRI